MYIFLKNSFHFLSFTQLATIQIFLFLFFSFCFSAVCPSTVRTTWWTPITWPSASAPHLCLCLRVMTRSHARPMWTSWSRLSSSTMRASSLVHVSLRVLCMSVEEPLKNTGELWVWLFCIFLGSCSCFIKCDGLLKLFRFDRIFKNFFCKW